jgi:hypothetical protein
MTIVALNSEHFDILENECVTSWLTYSGATAPGSLCPCSLTSVVPNFLALTLQTGHGMANWRLKTGAAVQAALQNLGSILSDPSSFLLSDEQLLALTSPEEQPKQRDEFDFSDDDAALVPSPRHQEKRKKKKRKSDGGRVVEGRGRASESRHRNEVRNEEERLRHSSASDSNEEQLVLRSEEQAIASPAPSPEREPARRKRVIAAAGSSDSDGELVVGTKERAEPTPVTEVRKRRQVVLSDDDE